MRNPVTRDGLGYVHDLPNAGISLRADRIRESSGEVTAEVVVHRAPQGHVARFRMNLLSPTTRGSVAKDLSARSPGAEWRDILERFCEGVLELERQGEPFQTIGRAPLRPEPPYLMRPMIFAGKPTILFGEGGVGKSSAIAAAIAVTVASGVAALDGWSVVTRGPVLVLDWEGDADDWNDAVARICAGLRIEPPALHYRRMSGSLDAQVNELAAFCDEQGVVLVIVDSLTWATRSMDRAAGIEEPVKRLFEALRHIGRSSLLIDHKSKAGIRDSDEGGNPIGSVVKVNAARASYELRSAGPPSADGTRHLALIARKLNPVAPQPPLGIAVKVTGGETLLWTEPVLLGDHIVVEAAKRSGVLWERIRDALLDAPLTAAQIVGRLGLDSKDPMRQVEAAMARKPQTFANNGHTDRSKRLWHLVMADAVSDDGALWEGHQVSDVPPAVLPDPLSTASTDNAPEHAPTMLRSMLPHAPTDAPVPPTPPLGGERDGSLSYYVGENHLSVTVDTPSRELSREDAPEHAPTDDWWDGL